MIVLIRIFTHGENNAFGIIINFRIADCRLVTRIIKILYRAALHIQKLHSSAGHIIRCINLAHLKKSSCIMMITGILGTGSKEDRCRGQQRIETNQSINLQTINCRKISTIFNSGDILHKLLSWIIIFKFFFQFLHSSFKTRYFVKTNSLHNSQITRFKAFLRYRFVNNSLADKLIQSNMAPSGFGFIRNAKEHRFTNQIRNIPLTLIHTLGVSSPGICHLFTIQGTECHIDILSFTSADTQRNIRSTEHHHGRFHNTDKFIIRMFSVCTLKSGHKPSSCFIVRFT